MAVALDIVKRSLWVLPVAIMVSAAFWGLDGVFSTLYGLAIVVVNFLLAGWMLQVGGRIGAAAMGAAAFFGFLVRLGLIMVAILAVRNQPWVELVPLGITIIVTHLGLLFWELRHISHTLAFPGLKPASTPNPYLPTSDGAPSNEVPPAPSASPTAP
ncbi:MAG: ATP synthase subunit I [Actinobacteria bacterium]|nr:ATP synthase subunit I [Actinomycetota bacterium]